MVETSNNVVESGWEEIWADTILGRYNIEYQKSWFNFSEVESCFSYVTRELFEYRTLPLSGQKNFVQF